MDFMVKKRQILKGNLLTENRLSLNKILCTVVNHILCESSLYLQMILKFEF